MLERDVEKYLIKRVRELGGEIRKVQWIGRRGAPDRLIFLHGLQMWVELKRPGGKPDPHQDREITRLRELGCRVEVLDSKEAIDETLDRARAESPRRRRGSG